MKKIALTILVVTSLFAVSAWSKEGGDQYPNGGENWFAGSAPPAGHYYVNYFGYYTGKLKDGAGQPALLSGSTPEVDATFNALRFVEMTRFKLLGGQYGAHVIVPVVYQSAYIGSRASNTNLGDVIINPFILGWHGQRWHALAAVDIFLPTGYYNKNDPRVSTGANYYGFDPLVAVSFIGKTGWEASGKFMYNLKTTNTATNYHSGQEFHADYAAGKHIGGWLVGVTGYGLKQTTDDMQNGVVVPATAGLYDIGRRGQVFAIGPSLGYTNARHMTVMVDWQHETVVRNRFGGDKFWIKAIIPVDSLFSHGPTQ
jgi:hypothetical protein